MPANQITGLEYIRVQITQVDIANRIAHVTDKTGSPMQCSWVAGAGGIVHIPQQGELWTAQKLGYTWHLDKLLDSQAQHAALVDDLDAGDTRISTGGTLQMSMSTGTINGQGFGPTYRDEYWSPDDGYDSITLSQQPASVETIRVVLNGVEVPPTSWVWDGHTGITFISVPMATGSLVVFYQSTATVYADASVVTGRARIYAVEGYGSHDEATVVGHGHASQQVTTGSAYMSTATSAVNSVTTVLENVQPGQMVLIATVASGLGADGSQPTVSDSVGGGSTVTDAVAYTSVPDLQLNLMLYHIAADFGSGGTITVTWVDVVDAIVLIVPVYNAASASVDKTGNSINPDHITLGSTVNAGIYAFASKGGSSSFTPNDGAVVIVDSDFNDTPSGLSLVVGKKIPQAPSVTIDVAFAQDTSTFFGQTYMSLRPA